MSSILKNLRLPLTVAVLGFASSSTSWSAPITINGTNSYSQSFNSLISTGSVTWADDSTLAGWYAQKSVSGAPTLTAGTGSSTAGSLYSFGSASATDRALGSVGSGTPGSFAWGIQFQNTGATATIGTLSFTGEQWRNGGNATAHTVTLWYKISPTAVTALNPGTSNTGWTALSSGDFTSLVNTTTAAALDGNASGNRTLISLNTGLTLNTGEYLMFRWSDPDNTGADHGLAVDDFSLSWTTAGGDTTPPTLASVSPLSPADNSTNVSIGTGLSVTFSESIAAGTGAITLYKQSDDSVVQAFTVGTTAVTISGATASLTPTTPLLNNTDYYVLIPSGVITDAATVPNNFAGISDKTVWNFKTIPADITPPTIVSVIPVTASTNIAPPTSLTITFSENVQIASSGNAKIYVKKVSDNSSAAEIDANLFGPISVTGAVATVPIPPLAYGVAYYVTIDAGAFEDVSTSNNAFVGLAKYSNPPTNTVLSWTFTTVDVPGLVTSYAQTFSGLTTATPTLPAGWSTSGAPGYSTVYRGDWGTATPDTVNIGATLGGIKGNASVFGYHHTSSTGTTYNSTTLVGTPLSQILTLRNTTGATLNNLTVAYKGRTNIPANTRLPAYAVTVNGTAVSALSYSTTDPDNTQRNVSLTGLGIANGETFQIAWSSFYPSGGSGSARQIGISDVVVNVGTGTETYPPSISGPLIPVLTTGSTTVEVQSNVISDGGSGITQRGYVYSVTSLNGAPAIGGANVSQVTDPSSTTGALNSTLAGLTPEVNYTVRGYATNANGTTYTGAVTFTTLGPPPSLTLTPYNQLFTGFGPALVFPAGWTALSDATPPVQTYGSAWTDTTTSTGGFSGAATPGVLGYRHTGSTGNLTVTLRMINGTANPLTSLRVGYQGRVSDTEEGRYPIWTVAVNGVAATNLTYSTQGNVDATVADTILLTPGNIIAPGAEFSITWTSNRGAGANSSKKIGISDVLVAIPTPPVLASASASSITSTTATLNGSVTSDGYSAITERGFVYAPTSTNSNPLINGTGVIKEVDGAVTTGPLTKALTGLTASTGYSLKAYATNNLGTTYSTVATFSTTAPGLSYDTWNDAIANQAANLDFDGDGLSNGAEFFMGTAGNAFTVNPGISGGTVTWPRASGTLISTFKVEVSSTLTNWTDASVTYPGSVSAPNGGPVTFTLPISRPPSLFIRLNVTP